MPGSGQTIPGGTTIAYGYVLTSILAGQISGMPGQYDTLWLNPDTVTIKAIGKFFDNERFDLTKTPQAYICLDVIGHWTLRKD